jgi:H+-translocating NAD(P) transhydrogenase subunit alpha
VRMGIPKEARAGETRVAATPDSVRKLLRMGAGVGVECSAGERAGFSDAEYEGAGARLVDAAEAFGADIVLKVRRPSVDELGLFRRGTLLVALLEPHVADGMLERLASIGVDSLAMELIPRISRAQAMDALS